MQRWTSQHAKFVGRVIFANFLNLPLENYESIIEEVEGELATSRLCRKWPLGDGVADVAISDFGLRIAERSRRNSAAIIVRRLSRANSLGKRGTRNPPSPRLRRTSVEGGRRRTSAVVAKIERTGKRFTIRYACEGFNKMYVIDNAVRDDLCADKNIRSTLFRLRRISSRNALTHALLKGIIEHQEAFLRSGDPTDLAPLSQVELTEWMNRGDGYVEERKAIRLSGDPELGDPGIRRSGCPSPELPGFRMTLNDGRITTICNSWISRLVNGISVIIPSGEEKPLKTFFPTQKQINKTLIKRLLDKENEDLQSGELRKPYTDNELRTLLEALLRKRDGQRFTNISRHSVGHCRKDMGIPPAKRRLSGYKYPPLSANFSMLYPLTVASVQNNAPASSGIYEFRLNPVRNKTQTASAISNGVKGQEIEYPKGKTKVIYIGSAKNLKKRIKEHLRANNKNGHIKHFLKRFDCSFRYVEFSKNWKEEEARLYSLFVTTYGASPKCNRVRP